MTAKHQDSQETKTGDKEESHALLWGLAIAFIVIAIGAMWAVDYYFSPEMLNPSVATDAVGK